MTKSYSARSSIKGDVIEIRISKEYRNSSLSTGLVFGVFLPCRVIIECFSHMTFGKLKLFYRNHQDQEFCELEKKNN